MIKFINQYVEGFLSWQTPYTFQLDRGSTLNLVKGENGHGKTSLIGSVPFTLFGVSVKDITKKELPTRKSDRRKEFQGTCTRTLFFDTNTNKYYLAARHIKYKGQTLGVTGGDSLLLFEGNNPELTDSNLRSDLRYNNDVQNEIETILGVGANVFLESVFFAQNATRLIEADRNSNLKMFEQLFEASWISEARDKADKEKKRLEVEIEKLNTEISKVDNKLETNKALIEEKISYKETWETNKKTALESLTIKSKEKTFVKYLLESECKTLKVRLAENNFDTESITLAEKALQTARKDNSVNSIEQEKADFTKVNKESVQSVIKAYTDLKEELTGENSKLEKLKAKLQDLETKEAKNNKIYNTKVSEQEKWISDLEVVRKRLENKKTTYKAELTAYDKVVEELNAALESSDTLTCNTCGQTLPKDKIDTHKHDIKKRIKVQKDLLPEYQKNYDLCVKQLSEKRVEINKVKSDLEVLHSTHKVDVRNIETTILESLKFVEDENKRVVNLLSESKILAQEKKDWYNNNINDFKQRLVESEQLYTKNVESAKSKLNLALEEQKKVKTYLEEIEKNEKAIISLESTLKSLNTQFEQEDKKELEDLKFGVLELEKLELEDKKAELAVNRLNLETDLEDTQWFVSKGFANSGLKAHLYTANLSKLNEKAKKYSSRLGYTVKFGMDLNSTRKSFEVDVSELKEINGTWVTVTQSYGAFSGGEQQKINLAILFAMHDLVASKFDCNIMQMDEIFKGLTSTNIDIAFEIIRDKVKTGKSVYVITHKNDIDSTYAKTINVNKNSYTSYIDE